MGLRVGVDVGGTFTKAVALDGDARVVARAVVPTTHSHADGVAAGVVEVVRQIAAEQGPDAIELVTHSTTQAVNALLEGDVVPVGILGMATAPHVGKARKRTALARIDLTDSQALRTVHEFIDTTGGFDIGTARAAVGRLTSAGIGALCVAEAFAPDDVSNEAAVAALATEAAGPEYSVSAGARRNPGRSVAPPSPRMTITGAATPTEATPASTTSAVRRAMGRIEALRAPVSVRSSRP